MAWMETTIGGSDVEAEHALQYKLLSEAERLLTGGNIDAARQIVRNCSTTARRLRVRAGAHAAALRSRAISRICARTATC